MATKNRTYGLLLTTSNADIYTVPPNYESFVKSIIVTNESSSPVKFSLDWYNSANSTYYTIAEQVTVLGNTFFQITDGFWLYKGDKFRGLALSNNAITVSVYVEETFVPQRS